MATIQGSEVIQRSNIETWEELPNVSRKHIKHHSFEVKIMGSFKLQFSLSFVMSCYVIMNYPLPEP